MKSRPLAVLALVLALAACSSGDSLPRLELGAAGSTNDALKSEASSGGPVAVGPGVEYVAGTDDWGDAADATDRKWPAWSFVAPSTAAQVMAEVMRVADAFGFAGEPVNNGDRTSWRLVDKEKGLTLQSTGDANVVWWNVWDESRSVAKDRDSADCPPGAACTAPDSMTPPDTVPAGRRTSVADAEKRASAYLAAMGVDVSPDALAWTSGQDPWGTNTTAVRMFRGAQTGNTWSFTFGADGALLTAAGSFFDLVEADSYPVVDVDSAIARLNKGMGFAYAVLATRGSGSGSAPAGGKQTVKVTSARMSLVQWWMSGGGQMMLPAYDLVLDNGSHVSVVAVTDRYVRFAGPTADDVPADSTPGSGSGSGSSGSSSGSAPPSHGTGGGVVEPAPSATVPPVTGEQARTLLGLTLAEAQKVCDGNGWTLRVASLEGKENYLTMDWQPGRLNVVILNGVVTDVSVG